MLSDERADSAEATLEAVRRVVALPAWTWDGHSTAVLRHMHRRLLVALGEDA